MREFEGRQLGRPNGQIEEVVPRANLDGLSDISVDGPDEFLSLNQQTDNQTDQPNQLFSNSVNIFRDAVNNFKPSPVVPVANRREQQSRGDVNIEQLVINADGLTPDEAREVVREEFANIATGNG